MTLDLSWVSGAGFTRVFLRPDWAISTNLGHRNLSTTARYLMIAASKVCATASPLESLDVLVPTVPDLVPV